MAISDRLAKSRSGQVFIPMNVDGGVIEESFMSSGKVALIIALLFGTFIGWVWVNGWNSGWVLKFIGHLIILYIDQWLVRKFVLEENYLYRMYHRMKEYNITTPAVFWDIASIKETEEGAILVYSDMKIGVILKVERDTVTGKSEDFREKHYDALSDFYKELNLRRYKFVQMNIMETAGKDPRLQKLDRLANGERNKNLAALIEAEVSYIKQITRSTLSDNDYFLIYTDDMNKIDTIIQDVIDCVIILLDGAFISFRILSSNEVIDLVREIYGVRYFDVTEATLNVFKDVKATVSNPFIITAIKLSDGGIIELNAQEQNRLKNLALYMKHNNLDYADVNVLEALKGKIRYNGLRREQLDDISEIENFEVVSEPKETVVDLDNYIFGVNESVTDKNISSNVQVKNDNDVANEKVGRNKRKNLVGKIGVRFGRRRVKEDRIPKSKIQHNENLEVNEEGKIIQEEEFIDFG